MSGIIAVNSSGADIFMAVEDSVTGDQKIFNITRPAPTPVVTKVYDPGGGSASNVRTTGETDFILFYGNFGTDLVVLKHEISTVTTTSISPPTQGADIFQPANVSPTFRGNVIAINTTDLDLFETEDDGVSYTTLRTDLNLIDLPQAMATLFGSNFEPHTFYIAGDTPSSGLKVYESPNEGLTLITELQNSALNTAAAIVGMSVVGQ